MGHTRTIRDAIVTDLQTITTANGYATTVRQVYTEPVGIEAHVFPFLELRPSEGGSSDSTELGSRGGESAQAFTVMGGIDSSTPLDDLMDLLDDVRNSIEKSTSTVCVLTDPPVIQATVQDWQLGPAGDEVAIGEREFTADIFVTYSYVRGSA